MMDANEDWVLEHEGELVEFIMGTQLEDVHIAWKQIVPRSTYARGSKRLDYIFISPNLMSTVRKSGYLGIHELMLSNHKMCYVDCDMQTFLCGNINQIIPPQMRAFKCDDKVRSQIFIKELNEHHKNSSIAKRQRDMGLKRKMKQLNHSKLKRSHVKNS